MAKKQKSYTEEFKVQIVELHNKAGKGITELSNEYGYLKAQFPIGSKIFLQ